MADVPQGAKDIESGTLSEAFNPKVGDTVLVTRLGDYQFPVTITAAEKITQPALAEMIAGQWPGFKTGDTLYRAYLDGHRDARSCYEFPRSKIIGPAPQK